MIGIYRKELVGQLELGNIPWFSDRMYAQSHDPILSAHEQVEEESVINRDGGHECTCTYNARGRSEDE